MACPQETLVETSDDGTQKYKYFEAGQEKFFYVRIGEIYRCINDKWVVLPGDITPPPGSSGGND